MRAVQPPAGRPRRVHFGGATIGKEAAPGRPGLRRSWRRWRNRTRTPDLVGRGERWTGSGLDSASAARSASLASVHSAQREPGQAEQGKGDRDADFIQGVQPHCAFSKPDRSGGERRRSTGALLFIRRSRLGFRDPRHQGSDSGTSGKSDGSRIEVRAFGRGWRGDGRTGAAGAEVRQRLSRYSWVRRWRSRWIRRTSGRPPAMASGTRREDPFALRPPGRRLRSWEAAKARMS